VRDTNETEGNSCAAVCGERAEREAPDESLGNESFVIVKAARMAGASRLIPRAEGCVMAPIPIADSSANSFGACHAPSQMPAFGAIAFVVFRFLTARGAGLT
jgi:hypothetical protein